MHFFLFQLLTFITLLLCTWSVLSSDNLKNGSLIYKLGRICSLSGDIVDVVSAEMVRGWWWVKEPAELTAILQALHPRGVREKVLHKHLTKHLEFLSEVCSRAINGENISAGKIYTAFVPRNYLKHAMFWSSWVFHPSCHNLLLHLNDAIRMCPCKLG